MAKSNLVTLGVVLGTICLLLIGGAYFAFSEASDSFDESMDNSEAGCDSFFGWCWFLPGGSFGCGFCLLGIFLVGLVVPIMFGGFLSGLVGIWSVPEQVVVVAPLPPPDPPAKPDVVDDEFAALERELEEIE
jgi:hypothetical protein